MCHRSSHTRLVQVLPGHPLAHPNACFFLSLCLLFAGVGQASARIIASLPWTLFTSLLTHGLVLLSIDAHCFVFWDLPGDVLAAPESALGLDRCNTSPPNRRNSLHQVDAINTAKDKPLRYVCIQFSSGYMQVWTCLGAHACFIVYTIHTPGGIDRYYIPGISPDSQRDRRGQPGKE